jgi:hypothetical protein
MVNESINFKYHRTATIYLKKSQQQSLHCPFMLTYYWHNAHENYSTPATSSKLAIKGCTIIRQKQKEISVVTKSDINPAYQITCETLQTCFCICECMKDNRLRNSFYTFRQQENLHHF